MSCTRAVLRAVFYQYFLLFIGLAIGFICNAEWIGFKSFLIDKSIKNIFFRVNLTPKIEARIKEIVAQKMFIAEGYPVEFEVLSSVVVANDEFCWISYKYRDQDGKLIFKNEYERVKWKTWEYNFEENGILDPIDTPEEFNDFNKKIINWQEKIKDAINTSEKRKIEILEQERLKKIQEAI